MNRYLQENTFSRLCPPPMQFVLYRSPWRHMMYNHEGSCRPDYLLLWVASQENQKANIKAGQAHGTADEYMFLHLYGTWICSFVSLLAHTVALCQIISCDTKNTLKIKNINKLCQRLLSMQKKSLGAVCLAASMWSCGLWNSLRNTHTHTHRLTHTDTHTHKDAHTSKV